MWFPYFRQMFHDTNGIDDEDNGHYNVSGDDDNNNNDIDEEEVEMERSF